MERERYRSKLLANDFKVFKKIVNQLSQHQKNIDKYQEGFSPVDKEDLIKAQEIIDRGYFRDCI